MKAVFHVAALVAAHVVEQHVVAAVLPPAAAGGIAARAAAGNAMAAVALDLSVVVPQISKHACSGKAHLQYV